ncbi:MAG: CooT family nickel-binding protein [Desulfobacterales bacterium]|nr:CooT family nickel-binding protein [Desulfobacterales bacterium]
MCEANAYLVKDGEEKIIMENVDILRPEEDGIYLQDIFGGQRMIKARIKEMNLVEHRILLEEE